MSKAVLIITYYWPPGSSPGVQRWLKFVKYLPELGWQPYILTVKNGSFPAEDASLMDEISEEVRTYRASTIEPFALYNMLRGKKGKSVEVGMGNIKGNKSLLSRIANYIRANYFIPDARKGWNFFAAHKMKEIIRRHNIEAVVTTGPPHSTHLLGFKLKKQFPEIPWLADFRDPWTSVYYNQLLNRTKRAEEKDYQLETQVLKTADEVSVISEGMKEEFKDRAENIHVLYNGYDPDDMASNPNPDHQHFEIAYIGNFKHSQNVPAFWNALSRLIKEHPKGKKIRLKIVGNIAQNINSALETYELNDFTMREPFVPHKIATRYMQEADVLYLPIPDIGNNKSIITGKIFEYLAARTPVLAIGPEDGDAAALLKTCERDEMLAYTAEEVIYKRLKNYFDHWINLNGQQVAIESDAHLKLTRKAITEKLSDILKTMITYANH
jgi:glycosyltransferase involved in cell wall biosynthesis